MRAAPAHLRSDPSSAHDCGVKHMAALQNARCNGITLPAPHQAFAWSRQHRRQSHSSTSGVRGCAGGGTAAAVAVTSAAGDKQQPLLRPLLIDNYDSYTYNLYQIVSEVYGGAC